MSLCNQTNGEGIVIKGNDMIFYVYFYVYKG
jgi:hypothetical protein